MIRILLRAEEMELSACAGRSLSRCSSHVLYIARCSSHVLYIARCSSQYGLAPVCCVGPRLLLSCSSLSVSHRRVGAFFQLSETNAGRFHGEITAAVGVAAAEDESFTEQNERLGRKGFQLLGSKEKKELRAYAHSLGKDINVQQVGKLGITPNVITSISDALEANEIIKVKVLENCDNEQDEIIAQLEDGTGAQTVGKIGRTLLLYRASLKKLAAAEEKNKADKPKARSRLAMSAGRNTVKSRRSTQ